MKRLAGAFGILFLLFVVFVCFSKGGTEMTYGAPNGRFQPCPDSPNCVCTQSTRPRERMAPVPTGGLGTDAVMNTVAGVIEGLERTALKERKGAYLRVEFKTKIFRFVDDVEFYHDAEAGLLHFKSASRIGYSDLGTNRKRMEHLSERIMEALGGAVQ